MEKWIFLLSIFGTGFYFSILSILGLSYEGIESGNYTYWFYLFLLLILSIICYCHDKLIEDRISIKELLVIYFISSFIVFIPSYNIYKNLNLSYPLEQLLFFIFLNIPAYISGYYFSYQKSRLDELSKNIEIIMVITTVGLFFSTFITLINGQPFENMGGASYQTTSYLAAFSFGINIFYLIWGSQVSRYKYFEKGIYSLLQFFMLIIQLFSMIIGGGRGAFVLLIVYLFTYTFILIKEGNYKLLFKYIFSFCILVLTIVIFVNYFLSSTELIFTGMERIFAFISPRGINWEGTSGRDNVYQRVIDTFYDRPIFGSGVFNYLLPHNIFLEILVATGVTGGSIFILLAFSFMYKLTKIIYECFGNIILLIILLYPLTMLMFSGSLFKSPELSFVVSYVFFYSTSARKNKKGYNSIIEDG